MSKRLYIVYNVRARKVRLMLFALLTACCMACSGSGSNDGTDPVVPPSPTTPKEQGTPVSFSSGLQEEREVSAGGTGANSMTRATGLEELLTNKSFKVWGYKNDAYDTTNGYTSYQTVFPGFIVNWIESSANTTTSNTHDWEYVGQASNQDIKYWDFGAKAYRYFAVAPADATLTSSAPAVYDANKTSATFTLIADALNENAAPYLSRLWFSNGTNPQYGQAVKLEFLKPFARVRFMFTFAEGITFGREVLTDPKFKPTSGTIATKGTVTVTYPLTGKTTTETWTTSAVTSSIESFTVDYTDSNQKWYTVLPADNQPAFEVSVMVNSLDSKATVPAEYMNWKAGYEYTYKFKILTGGGVTVDIVQVAINNWVEKKDIDHDVYNW